MNSVFEVDQFGKSPSISESKNKAAFATPVLEHISVVFGGSFENSPLGINFETTSELSNVVRKAGKTGCVSYEGLLKDLPDKILRSIR